MAFFDKVPQGRILNRFDRDLGEAQEMLLSMLVGLFGMLVSVALQVVVIGINIPLLLLIAPWWDGRSMCCSAATGRCNSSCGASPRCCAPRSTSASARPSAAPRPAPGRGRAFRAGPGAAPL